MPDFEPLIERVTRRLRVDPDLRLEVMKELRDHLEDAAAELRRAGRSEADAAEEAARAFGDEGLVADQLWAANRRRLRVRQVLKWTARTALLPGAAAIAISIAWSALVPLAFLPMIATVRQPKQPAVYNFGRGIAPLALNAQRRLFASLTPDQQLLERPLFDQPGFLGADEGAAIRDAKLLSDRWPDNPVYYAGYVNELIPKWSEKITRYEFTASDLEAAIPILDRGARLEPDNGYYDAIKASLLVAISTVEEARPVPTGLTDSRGQSVDNNIIHVEDPARFKQAIAALRQAAEKPVLNSHIVDMTNLRLAALPAPRRLGDLASRWEMELWMRLSSLEPLRLLAERTNTYAAQVAAKGQAEEARQIVRSNASLGRKLALGGATKLELLVGEGIAAGSELSEDIVNYQLGQKDAAQHFRMVEQAIQQEAILSKENALRTPQMPAEGLMYAGTWGQPAPSSVISGERRAEYAVADQFALAILIAGLGLFALIGAASAAVQRWITREAQPLWLMPRWKETAAVILLAVVLPLTLFGVYAWATPLNERQVGLHLGGGRLLIEYVALAATVFTLLTLLVRRLVRRRAAEVGIRLPALTGGRLGRAVLAAVPLLAVLLTCGLLAEISAVDIPASLLLPTIRSVAPGIAAVLGLSLLGWGIVLLNRRRRMADASPADLYAGTISRSAMPVVGVAALVAALFVLPLRFIESSAVAKVAAAGPMESVQALEHSPWHLLRDRLAAEQADADSQEAMRARESE